MVPFPGTGYLVQVAMEVKECSDRDDSPDGIKHLCSPQCSGSVRYIFLMDPRILNPELCILILDAKKIRIRFLLGHFFAIEKNILSNRYRTVVNY
jgi:hypothetical protein